MTPRTALRVRPRSLAAGVLALVVALMLGATPASAATSTPLKALWGPAQVGGVSQFPIYQDLGVDLFQTGVTWAQIAPTRPADPTDPNDPAYRWPADLDLAVAEGTRTGIGVLVLVMGTPDWAQAQGRPPEPRHRPLDGHDYAKFMEALARRYPAIRHFMVWGEPNRIVNYGFDPTGDPKQSMLPGEQPGSILPRTTTKIRSQIGEYARMLDATYVRLKRLNAANVVIGGNTTTDGEVDPFNWAKWLRLRTGKPPRMDLWGHNPFATRGPDLKKPMIRRGAADMSDLDDLIPWVKRWQSRSGRNAKLGMFISEFTAPTDVNSFEFGFHVTRAVQARWLRQAWNVTKSLRLYGFGWIGLYDVAGPNGTESRTGLIDASGVHKPSYDAFKRAR